MQSGFVHTNEGRQKLPCLPQPDLLDIIDQQSMQGSLLITSQFPPEKWYDLFNDPTVADAILDRIVHRAHFMELKGESMRKVRAKKG